MADQKSVLIAGYYGFGNTGDEAILTTMVGRLRLYFRAITVVSGNPAATTAAYDVQAVGWRDLAAILDAAEASDLIILGGGGLFQDYWGVDPSVVLTRHHSGLAYFSTFPVLAALLDKPLMLYAVGVGPLLTEAGRSYTRLAFEQAVIASVRDQLSQREAAHLTTATVALTADPAFLLEPAANAESILAHEGIPPADLRVGVALRHWELSGDPERWSAEIAAALDCFIEQTGASILFIPFQTRQPAEGALTDDRAAADRVRQQMKHPTFALNGDYTPAETLAVIARCHLVVAMRLHAAILAAKAAVPVIGLAYDPKVTNIVGDLGFESLVLDLETLTRR